MAISVGRDFSSKVRAADRSLFFEMTLKKVVGPLARNSGAISFFLLCEVSHGSRKG